MFCESEFSRQQGVFSPEEIIGFGSPPLPQEPRSTRSRQDLRGVLCQPRCGWYIGLQAASPCARAESQGRCRHLWKAVDSSGCCSYLAEKLLIGRLALRAFSRAGGHEGEPDMEHSRARPTVADWYPDVRFFLLRSASQIPHGFLLWAVLRCSSAGKGCWVLAEQSWPG